MPNQGTVGIGEEHTVKSIRLLGGMRWPSSVGYEPLFNDGGRERLVGTASADLVRCSHNFASGDRGREWCADRSPRWHGHRSTWDDGEDQRATATMRLRRSRRTQYGFTPATRLRPARSTSLSWANNDGMEVGRLAAQAPCALGDVVGAVVHVGLLDCCDRHGSLRGNGGAHCLETSWSPPWRSQITIDAVVAQISRIPPDPLQAMRAPTLEDQDMTNNTNSADTSHFEASTSRHLPHSRFTGAHGPSIADRYDVIVVGARVAGAATAMLLARRGLSVLAIDRGRLGSDIMSTHSIAMPGVFQLSRWGLLDAIRERGTPATRTVIFDYDGERATIDVPQRGDVDGLYNPRRTVLDPILVDAAVDAGADVRHGIAMREIVRDESGRVDGVVIDDGVGSQLVRARFVVGADGARSRVAAQAGAEVLHRESVGAASIYTYFEGLDSHQIVNHYAAGRAVGVIPTNDGNAVVWAGMPNDRFAAQGRHDVAAAHARIVAQVPELADQLAGARRRSGFRAFSGVPGFLRQPWGDGWALVGDAAYFKDPLSAHGITDALIGAELVADAIGACHDGEDEVAAMTTMQAMRDAMASEMMPAVAAAAGFPADMSEVQSAFRAMSIAMRNEWALIETGFRVPAAA
jgi:flavin-dependent dehydrogenase